MESVPALGGGRAKEDPATHGAEAGRGTSEVDGGGGSKGAGRSGSVEEVRQIWRGDVVTRLDSEPLASPEANRGAVGWGGYGVGADM